MTETFFYPELCRDRIYRTGFNPADHSTFGGKLYFSDFGRRTTMREMAEKIMADRNFDEQCRKNLLEKQRRNYIEADKKGGMTIQ